MPEEPTLGEAVRRLEDRFADLRDDLQQAVRRMDEKVDQKLYDLRHDALQQRVAKLETLREQDAERIVATRRWLVGAVIVPLVGVLMPIVIMLMRGSGS